MKRITYTEILLFLFVFCLEASSANADAYNFQGKHWFPDPNKTLELDISDKKIELYNVQGSNKTLLIRQSVQFESNRNVENKGIRYTGAISKKNKDSINFSLNSNTLNFKALLFKDKTLLIKDLSTRVPFIIRCKRGVLLPNSHCTQRLEIYTQEDLHIFSNALEAKGDIKLVSGRNLTFGVDPEVKNAKSMLRRSRGAAGALYLTAKKNLTVFTEVNARNGAHLTSKEGKVSVHGIVQAPYIKLDAEKDIEVRGVLYGQRVFLKTDKDIDVPGGSIVGTDILDVNCHHFHILHNILRTDVMTQGNRLKHLNDLTHKHLHMFEKPEFNERGDISREDVQRQDSYYPFPKMQEKLYKDRAHKDEYSRALRPKPYDPKYRFGIERLSMHRYNLIKGAVVAGNAEVNADEMFVISSDFHARNMVIKITGGNFVLGDITSLAARNEKGDYQLVTAQLPDKILKLIPKDYADSMKHLGHRLNEMEREDRRLLDRGVPASVHGRYITLTAKKADVIICSSMRADQDCTIATDHLRVRTPQFHRKHYLHNRKRYVPKVNGRAEIKARGHLIISANKSIRCRASVFSGNISVQMDSQDNMMFYPLADEHCREGRCHKHKIVQNPAEIRSKNGEITLSTQAKFKGCNIEFDSKNKIFVFAAKNLKTYVKPDTTVKSRIGCFSNSKKSKSVKCIAYLKSKGDIAVVSNLHIEMIATDLDAKGDIKVEGRKSVRFGAAELADKTVQSSGIGGINRHFKRKYNLNIYPTSLNAKGKIDLVCTHCPVKGYGTHISGMELSVDAKGDIIFAPAYVQRVDHRSYSGISGIGYEASRYCHSKSKVEHPLIDVHRARMRSGRDIKLQATNLKAVDVEFKAKRDIVCDAKKLREYMSQESFKLGFENQTIRMANAMISGRLSNVLDELESQFPILETFKSMADLEDAWDAAAVGTKAAYELYGLYRRMNELKGSFFKAFKADSDAVKCFEAIRDGKMDDLKDVITNVSLCAEYKKYQKWWEQIYSCFFMANTFKLKAGRDIKLKGLTGKFGVFQAKAGRDIYFGAVNGKSGSDHFSVGASINIKDLSAHVNTSYAQQFSNQHKPSEIDADKVDLTAGRNIVMESGLIKAKEFKAEADRLLLQAVQDRSGGSQGGFGVSTKSVSISASAFSSKMWQVAQIQAKKFSATIKKQTHLEGAVISALEGTLDSRTVTHKDLTDKSKAWGVHLSFSDLDKLFDSNEKSAIVGLMDVGAYNNSTKQKRRATVERSITIITKSSIKDLNRNLQKARGLKKKYGYKFRFVVPIGDYSKLGEELRSVGRNPTAQKAKDRKTDDALPLSVAKQAEKQAAVHAVIEADDTTTSDDKKQLQQASNKVTNASSKLQAVLEEKETYREVKVEGSGKNAVLQISEEKLEQPIPDYVPNKKDSDEQQLVKSTKTKLKQLGAAEVQYRDTIEEPLQQIESKPEVAYDMLEPLAEAMEIKNQVVENWWKRNFDPDAAHAIIAAHNGVENFDNWLERHTGWRIIPLATAVADQASDIASVASGGLLIPLKVGGKQAVQYVVQHGGKKAAAGAAQAGTRAAPRAAAGRAGANRGMGANVGQHPGIVQAAPKRPAANAGAGQANGQVRFKRWQRGESPDKPLANGSNPSWGTVRKRYWKNRHKEAIHTNEFKPKQLDRMDKGLAPLDKNSKGQMVSRELHHHIPRRFKGSNHPINFREVTPEQHAALDAFRNLGR